MKKIRLFWVITVILLITSIGVPGSCQPQDTFSTKPVTNQGKKWHIAYYEGGEYIDYQKIFTEILHGLMQLGWIEVIDIPAQNGEQTSDLWGWLNRNMKSDYIEFVKDAHYSAKWDETLRKEVVGSLMKRLVDRKDIDLLIAMGTWAGKDFANNKHSTPTMVVSASDPITAGIIKSVEDSGFDHVHAQVDPFRYERQIRIFHEVINFKRLGVAYENTVNGKSYAAIDSIEKVAKEKGFEIVRCFTKSDVADTAEADASVVQCFKELVSKSDAIYVTVQGGVNTKSIPNLVKIANDKKIPTFSQSGSEEVKYGFLLSLSQAGFKYIGLFHAETFAKVFNGAKPNQIGQSFKEPPKLAINLMTAEIIGFNPPMVILGASDEIFRTITPLKKMTD
ncbi:MAG: ABC transporter substrate-binding protein [Desulfobacterales bacterium]|nr:ABC transporter substrate-binding protein [Desulfobacterales bacterium]